jgi:hypothetical protein
MDFIPAPNSTISQPNYSFYNKWQDGIKTQWASPGDKHFNEQTHLVLANHFFEYIDTYRK